MASTPGDPPDRGSKAPPAADLGARAASVPDAPGGATKPPPDPKEVRQGCAVLAGLAVLLIGGCAVVFGGDPPSGPPPDVSGQQLKAAKQQLEDAGWDVKEQDESDGFDFNEDNNRVCSVTPAGEGEVTILIKSDLDKCPGREGTTAGDPPVQKAPKLELLRTGSSCRQSDDGGTVSFRVKLHNTGEADAEDVSILPIRRYATGREVRPVGDAMVDIDVPAGGYETTRADYGVGAGEVVAACEVKVIADGISDKERRIRKRRSSPAPTEPDPAPDTTGETGSSGTTGAPDDEGEPNPDAAPVPGGTCAETPEKNFPVGPGDPRDRDNDGIACEEN